MTNTHIFQTCLGILDEPPSGNALFIFVVLGAMLVGWFAILYRWGRGSAFRDELKRQYGERKGFIIWLSMILFVLFVWFMLRDSNSPLNRWWMSRP